MKFIKLALPLISLGAAMAVPCAAGSRTIYGADDRIDFFAVSPELQKLADSTVTFFPASQVGPDGALSIDLTETFGKNKNLCATERFYSQPSASMCSGALVAPGIVMTAGHCSMHFDCAKTKIVFGYAVKEAGVMPSRIPPEEIYGCAGIIAEEFKEGSADYALLKTDRPVTNHVPLRLNRTERIEAGAVVVAMGHPYGIPLKIGGGATVRDASHPDFFVTDTDTYSYCVINMLIYRHEQNQRAGTIHAIPV